MEKTEFYKKIFEIIGADSQYYVEFGVYDGKECITRNLRENYGWNGLMMEGCYENPLINLQKEFVTAENINELFQKYQVPEEFDLLSIDIDFNDFYVWKAISEQYSPRVVVIEYNPVHRPFEDKVVKYDPQGQWDGTDYYGASILAYYNLARKIGYSLVYAEDRGINLFFIRDDVLNDAPVLFKDVNNVNRIYKKANQYGFLPDPQRRPYIEAGKILEGLESD